MGRLIDADKLSADMYHEAFEKDSDMQKWDSGCWIRYKMFENVLKAQPTVQPKCGKWIDAVIPNDNGGLQVQVCDQCNTFFPLAYTGGGHHFCPNCGADMRGDKHEID